MTDWNKPETEQDGERAQALRLLKVRQQFQALTGRTHELLPSPSNTPATTASTSNDNPNTSK
jgi:hypothetical protein